MIFGERIRQIRELNDWTQAELAERLKVSQSFVAQIEANWKPAPDDLVAALLFKTRFPRAFLETPPNEGLPLGSMLFRAHSDMPERELKAMHRHAEMAYEVVRRMVANPTLKQVPVRVPHLNEVPVRSAVLTRSELGLGPDTPVPNMIATMEAAGILVIALPRAFNKGDAFSGWATTDHGPRRPIVIISADRPADRLRMSAAHELAHLVMHQPAQGTPKQMEDEAKEFASAFLMPADAMRRDLEMAGGLTLDSFLSLKVKWGVSVAAMIVRAERLGLVTPRKYRTLHAALRSRGWLIHEPLSNKVPLERPRAVRQMAELLHGGPRIDYKAFASSVGYPDAFLKDLMSAHAGGAGSRPVAVTNNNRASSYSAPHEPSVLDFRKKV